MSKLHYDQSSEEVDILHAISKALLECLLLQDRAEGNQTEQGARVVDFALNLSVDEFGDQKDEEDQQYYKC